jgi:mono/diheme cytochrome c family protein
MNRGTTSRGPFRRLFGIIIVGTAVCGVGAVVARGQSTATATTWSGVYTEAQAKQGETVYMTHCVDCHGEDFAGREQAPALAGLGFMDKWNRTPLRKLFEIVEQMPPDEPKVLPPQQYADVLAYLLSANGFPAGQTRLTADRQTLGRIEIKNVQPAK